MYDLSVRFDRKEFGNVNMVKKKKSQDECVA